MANFLSKALLSPTRVYFRRRAVSAPNTALLWWGSYGFLGQPTLGDLLAVNSLAASLRDAGDFPAILSHPELGISDHMAVPDLFALTPEIKRLVWVCGPLLDRETLRDFLKVQAHARKVAVGVSILPNNLAMTARFDAIVPRDGAPDAIFDLSAPSLIAPEPDRVTHPRRVGLCLRGEQKEYGPDRRGGWQKAEALLRQVADSMGLEIVPVDTRLTPSQSAADVERHYAAADIMLTTRMHGALLSLARGCPVIAIDQIPGGAKVSAVMSEIGWRFVFGIETVTPEILAEAYQRVTSAEGYAAILAAQERIRERSGLALRRSVAAILGRDVGVGTPGGKN